MYLLEILIIIILFCCRFLGLWYYVIDVKIKLIILVYEEKFFFIDIVYWLLEYLKDNLVIFREIWK